MRDPEAQGLVSLQDYTSIFVQRYPHYGLKIPGKTWVTREKPLSDNVVRGHLSGRYSIGSLSRWYPEFALLDIDERQLDFVEKVRSEIGLNDTNSMLCGSESPNSYHLILKPQYNGQPMTVNLLQSVMRGYALARGIEIYPQKNRVIRLPLGKNQACLDAVYRHLDEWENKLYWFGKLDEIELSAFPRHQTIFAFPDSRIQEIRLPSMEEGRNLLECGLQNPSSRHYSQFQVLYYLWRCDVPPDIAIETTCAWIKRKHNGFSKDILRYPHRCRDEIKRQAQHIYTKYNSRSVYPDYTHNNQHGYITEPDIGRIIKIAGSIDGISLMPVASFLFHIVKYSYPRRHRKQFPVHTDKLIQWSSKNSYGRYLDALKEKGIVDRGKSYLTGQYSKPLTVRWNHGQSEHAVKYEGRAVDTFSETVRMLYRPDDMRAILRGAGMKRTAAHMATERIYQGEMFTKGETL